MFVKRLLALCWAIILFAAPLDAEADVEFGPFYDLFPLTLASGQRTEVAGPLFNHEKLEGQNLWASPPIFSYLHDPSLEMEEFDFLYPLLSYDRFGSEYRFHILQVFAFSGGQTQEEIPKRRFTLFPFYFQQRSPDAEDNYTALLPLYGTIRNRLFRDEIFFVFWPLFVRTHKRDVVTVNYPYPIVHRRRGNALQGWQVWPLVGHEHKEPTTRTNSLDEMEIVGGHERLFAPWPFFMKNLSGIGTENPETQVSVLPLFTVLRSPRRDSLTAPWPLGLTLTEDRGKKYKEVGVPWPLIVFARGEGKRVSRVWPLYSRASSATQESDFYLWPLYKFNRYHAGALDRRRHRVLFFLYSNSVEKNVQTGEFGQRTDFWPLFTKRRDLATGNERLQVLSILEPLLPNSKSIDRNYSPLWSIWRAEKNPKKGARSQSFLWNLYRREVTPEAKRTTLLFGLFQSRATAEGKTVKVCFVPFGKKMPSVSAPVMDEKVK